MNNNKVSKVSLVCMPEISIRTSEVIQTTLLSEFFSRSVTKVVCDTDGTSAYP